MSPVPRPSFRPALLLAALTLLPLGAALPWSAAHAQTLSDRAEARVDRRQARQDARIDQGIANGSLTAPEARRLERREGRIDRAEDRALATGGGLGPREAAALEARQDAASRAIRRQKHDAQMRP